MNKIIIYIFIFFIISNCSNKTTFSGKYLNQAELDNINFFNKEILVNQLGSPSYVDPIENKFFYFTEKSKKESILKKEIKYSYIFVFKFDESETIIETKVYDIKNVKDVKFNDDKTENEIIKKGLLEKIFGGVGTQQEIPTTP